MGLTDLEQAVLREICAQFPVQREALERQLATAEASRRENMGAGFLTGLEVDRSLPPAATLEGAIGDILAEVEGIAHGMGFVLWVEAGYAGCLKGFLCGPGSTESSDLTTLRHTRIGRLGFAREARSGSPGSLHRRSLTALAGL